MPDFVATTDLAVGFPGETEADLPPASRRWRTGSAKTHLFRYWRGGARASRMADRVPPEIVERRRAAAEALRLAPAGPS
ncbi:hypothetical protein HS125_02825 [bacterium]|nr:hypothetical protein [bacterium]